MFNNQNSCNWLIQYLSLGFMTKVLFVIFHLLLQEAQQWKAFSFQPHGVCWFLPNTHQKQSCVSNLKTLRQCLKAWHHKSRIYDQWMTPQTKPVAADKRREGFVYTFWELTVLICTYSANKLHLILILERHSILSTSISHHQGHSPIQKSVPSSVSQANSSRICPDSLGSFVWSSGDDVFMSRNKIQSILIGYI